MVDYYTKKAALTKDVERALKKNIGYVIDYMMMCQQIKEIYGFEEKILFNELKIYFEKDQIFWEEGQEGKMLGVNKEWIMPERKKLFEGF